jgi:hypothetical protein
MPRRQKRSKKCKIPRCPLAIGVLPELHELIFQHFDPADVLILSETSKHWWNAIGESRKCMQQIRLGLENWESTETTEDIARVMGVISKSTRRYQNIRINSNDDQLVSTKAIQLLKYFAPSLIDVRCLNADEVKVDEKFRFPRLERLQFINNVTDVDELFLHGCKELRELNLKHHYWADDVPVRDCLKMNAKLQMLKLWDTGISTMFKVYEPNSFKFQLKRFATGCDGDISEETEANFIQFLESQSKSIEAIRFRSGLDGVNSLIINKVFQMSAMKIVHLDGIGDLKDLKLKVNSNILELRLPWSVDTLNKLIPFLSVVPKAKVLFLRKINMEILNYIAVQMKELQILYYTRAEGCMGCFKKILSSNKDANKEIMLVNKEWY